LQKYDYSILKYNFVFGFVWVWNFLSYIKGRMYAEGVWE
jgi:hypothetical protein